MPGVVFPALGSPNRSSRSCSDLYKQGRKGFSRNSSKSGNSPRDPLEATRTWAGGEGLEECDTSPGQAPPSEYIRALREFEKCRVTSGYSVESMYTALNPRGTETLPLVEFAQNMSYVTPTGCWLLDVPLFFSALVLHVQPVLTC